MTAKLNRLRMLDLALFVLVLGGVAVNTACAAQENGLDGERAGARAESSEGEQVRSQPNQDQAAKLLTLTLSGPSRCTTTRGQSYGNDEAIYDDEGNYLRSERKFVGHYEVRQFAVSWTVSGGAAPYALTIDGASEDESGSFAGASGQGMVYCADTAAESFIDEFGDRAFRADPMVDSGWKAVRAVVTDASGRTAEAMIKVYVILSTASSGTPLSGGETYRIRGHLFTIPDGVRGRVGGYEEVACEGTPCEDSFNINLEGDDFTAAMYFGARSGREYQTDGRYFQLKDGVRGATEAETRRREINRLLDELSNSAGVAPTAEGDR
ncbi:MAG: hypothetical protein OXD50_16355 [Chloroflexi bacterium]|nr:hypothetical protein [Chloroflexota bacterium]